MNVRILDAPIPSVEIHLRSDDYTFKFGNNDFLFQIHDQVTNPNEKLYYMSAELSNGEFPVSFYNVNETNNKLNIFYGFPATGMLSPERNLFIPIGNYNMGQLLTEIDKLLTAEYPVGNTLDGGTNYLPKPQISWSSYTNKVTIQTFSQFSYSVKRSTANKLIGFTDDTLFVSGVATSFTGNAMCDIRGITNLFVHTDLFSNGFSTTTQKDNNSKNILARVPVDAGAYGTILYKPLAPHNIPIPKKSFRTFRVSIRDIEGRIIDMNLMKWSATLTIRFHNKSNIPQHQESFTNTNRNLQSNFTNFNNTTHQLINYIKEITDEYKNGNLDYSKLIVK